MPLPIVLRDRPAAHLATGPMTLLIGCLPDGAADWCATLRSTVATSALLRPGLACQLPGGRACVHTCASLLIAEIAKEALTTLEQRPASTRAPACSSPRAARAGTRRPAWSACTYVARSEVGETKKAPRNLAGRAPLRSEEPKVASVLVGEAGFEPAASCPQSPCRHFLDLLR